MGMTKVRKIIPDILIDMVKKQVNSIDDVNEQVKTIAPQPKKCGAKIMLSADIVKQLTKSEWLLFDVISMSGGLCMSIKEIAKYTGYSANTVQKSMTGLVKKKLVKKTYFYVCNVKKCSYQIEPNLFLKFKYLSFEN